MNVRYACRALARQPGFTAIVVATLALGIGANTTIFSLVHAILWRPLPVRDPGRLVHVYTGTAESRYNVASYPNYVYLRDHAGALAGLAAYSPIAVTLAATEQAEVLDGAIVSGNYFTVLGLTPAAGRFFAAEEDSTPGTHPVVVLAHRFWQSRLAGDHGVIGSRLRLNGVDFTIIGVAPPRFRGVTITASPQFYAPMAMQALLRPPRGGFVPGQSRDLLGQRSAGWLRMVGRVRDGVGLEQAQAALSTTARQLAQAFPEVDRGLAATVLRAADGDPQYRATLVDASALAMSVVGIVLLIACANVANLLLAKAAARRREIGVRLALGASRSQLVRQLLTESVILAALGGLAGLLLAVWAGDLLNSWRPADFPDFDLRLDASVLAFTFLLSLGTGVLFGLAPAWQATRASVAPALKAGDGAIIAAGRRFHLRNVLVAAQVGLSLVLLISTGLLVRSLQQLQAVDVGLRADKIALLPLRINFLELSRAQAVEFYRQAVERAEALPGVESASLARVAPLSGARRTVGMQVEGHPQPDPERPEIIEANVVAQRYFQTMGTPLLAGREFDARDTATSPRVAVINEALARRYWPGQNPLGRRLRLNVQDAPWLEVVGVTKDAKYRSMGEEIRPCVFWPLAQQHETGVILLVRAAGDPAALGNPLRGMMRSLDRNLPLDGFRTMPEQMRETLYPARAGAAVVAFFAFLALALAALGIYGVLAYAVARRNREIGVRMALGARSADVLRMVLREGMTLVAVGGALGFAVALGLTRLLKTFLFEVSPADPLTFALVPAGLALVAAVACWLPAQRATKVDPLEALRYE